MISIEFTSAWSCSATTYASCGASEGWRAPRDFGDSFTILGAHGVIDDALAGRLRGLAGLRNRLVHVYDEIDDTRVHTSLAAGLPDLDTFATALAKFVS